jgi:RNA polymerase sigma factor (sigma-70 family)
MKGAVTMSIKKQWESFTPDEKIKAITKYINMAANDVLLNRTDNKANITTSGFINRHGIHSIISDAFLKIAEWLEPEYLDRLNDKRNAKGWANITIKSLIYRAVAAAIRNTHRANIKHDVAQSITITDDDGNKADLINVMLACRNSKVETEAIMNIALAKVMDESDETDKIILDKWLAGHTVIEIGNEIGKSGVAAHKRINKLRARLKNELSCV